MTDSRSFENSEPDEIQLRVLVVDDNAPNRLLMEAMLTELGCVVSLAANGEAGSGIARANPFDLIVMDLQMPVLDGDGATRRIRADGASKQAFVVRWTTEDNTRLNRELYDGELPKPLNCSPLIAAVSLASRRALYRMDLGRRAPWQGAEERPPGR
jgi:CheY-like chemotaxis protein